VKHVFAPPYNGEKLPPRSRSFFCYLPGCHFASVAITPGRRRQRVRVCCPTATYRDKRAAQKSIKQLIEAILRMGGAS